MGKGHDQTKGDFGKPIRLLSVAVTFLFAAACSAPPNLRGSAASPSAPRSANPPVAQASALPSASPATGPIAAAASVCPGLDPTHNLVIAYLVDDQSKSVVRDVQDPDHGVTLCALPGGSPRFISATLVGIANPGDIFTLDLLSGARSQVLTYVHNDGSVVTWDWSPDKQSFAYGRMTSDGKAEAFHLINAGIDRLITTLATPNGSGLGRVRVEYSLDGKYVAFGVLGTVASGEQASVQVRRSDGSLVFGSAGTARFVWAGPGNTLYFDDGTAIQAWTPAKGSHPTGIRAWADPVSSPDLKWLAFQDADYRGDISVMDVGTGQTRQLTFRTLGTPGPRWLTSRLLKFEVVTSCPSPGIMGPCSSRPTIYDMATGATSPSGLGYVFASWPRGTSSWI
jgi:hypothetical protein